VISKARSVGGASSNRSIQSRRTVASSFLWNVTATKTLFEYENILHAHFTLNRNIFLCTLYHHNAFQRLFVVL
jgi:hypothetical protein